MFHIIAAAMWVLLAWRFGDWRNWTKYQSTILFIIMGDLLHHFLMYQQPLWLYDPAPPLPNHTLVNLLVMFVIYPCGMLIYLYRYPKGFKQIPYVLTWALLWAGVEWLLLRLNLMEYSRQWRYAYSLLFDLFIFIMMRLHFKKPLLAYGLTIVFTVWFLHHFDVGIDEMK